MSAITKSVTRQELYEAVWRTPITKLTLEWGVSNTSIVSACDQMNVPRPGAGHWSSVHRGWQVESDPLPPPEVGTAASAILKSATPRRHAARVKDAVGASESNFPVVTMVETFDQAHPLVRKMRQLLRWEKEDRRGTVEAAWRERPFDIRVAKSNVDRALKILDAVIKEVLSRGGRLEKTGKADTNEMQLIVDGEGVKLRIYEGLERREITEADRAEHYFSNTDVWQLDVSGELRFKIEHPNWFFREKLWSDGRRGKLEERLGEIFETIFRCAAEAKATRLEREQERVIAAREYARQAEERARMQRLEERRARLMQGMAAWRQAQGLRDFVAACEAKLRVANRELPVESEEAKWITWARQQAELADPLATGWLEQEVKGRRDATAS